MRSEQESLHAETTGASSQSLLSEDEGPRLEAPEERTPCRRRAWALLPGLALASLLFGSANLWASLAPTSTWSGGRARGGQSQEEIDLTYIADNFEVVDDSFPDDSVIGLRATTITESTRLFTSTTTATTTRLITETSTTRTTSTSTMAGEWLHGPVCDDYRDVRQADTGLPSGCFKSVLSYKTDGEVKRLCESKLPHWQNLADQAPPSSDCEVDPVTREMKCGRHASCSGGEEKTASLEELQTNVVYDCGSGCQGSLRADCCATCEERRKDPSSLDVDNVTCLGCNPEEVRESVEIVDCKMNERVFRCEARGMCAAGVVEKRCRRQQIRCQVYPCDSCSDPGLKAQCCSACLNQLCNDRSPEARMTCQGCEDLPSEQWWALR